MRFLLYLFVFIVLATVILGYAVWCYAHAKKNESFQDGESSTHTPKP